MRANRAINQQPNTPGSSCSGFTLIELIMVVVILGVLAVFALAKFSSLSSDAKRASMEAVLWCHSQHGKTLPYALAN